MRPRNVALVGLLAVTLGNAQAALLDRGGGLIHDDVLNVTWLQDANYAKTSGYDADGLMSWAGANAWAANLVYGGYSDWRLPTTSDTGTPGCNSSYGGTDCGYNPTGSEMAHMYYDNLGLKSRLSTTGTLQPDFGIFGNGTFDSGQNDVGLIHNLQSSVYWSSTAFAPSPSTHAWIFRSNVGYQDMEYQPYEYYAWVVRDGDVASIAAPVPEPETYAMLLAGLGLLGLTARRRKQKTV